MANDFRTPILSRTRIVVFVVLLGLLLVSVIFAFNTRDAMEQLSFLREHAAGKKALVDTSPWDTARALAPLAVSAEERDFARQAEHLADHDVDQAFACALRLATLKVQQKNLTGDALALSQKVSQLQELVKEDQTRVQKLSPKGEQATQKDKDKDKEKENENTGNAELDIAKAQLVLDTDQLDEAKRDLARVSGDETYQIQQELSAHEQTMSGYDKAAQNGGELAVISVGKSGTLASRIQAWFSQNDRYRLLEQARGQTEKDIKSLTDARSAFLSAANQKPDSTREKQALADLHEQNAKHQISVIFEDRIATKQELLAVYSRWSKQLDLQHGILLHLILWSVVLVLLVLMGMLLVDTLTKSLLSRLKSERRQMLRWRTILELTIEVTGVVLIFLVIFGLPEQIPTILGLAAAGLAIVLADFILAFLGWFFLMGNNGIRVGDWVEINGVSGEVTQIGLMSTTLLETGKEKGLPTGRHARFLNSFAIRGQFFNFSTSGQWMWDELAVTIPASGNIERRLEHIHQIIEEETRENTRIAEDEWKRSVRGRTLSHFSAKPVINLRPAGGNIDVQVRYVTQASARFDLRNRLYGRLVELLRDSDKT